MTHASAAELRVAVTTPDGTPLTDAVVVVRGDQEPPAAERPLRDTIDQIDREFVPFVSVIRTGTVVEFPNHDDIRHHVYSFSEAKRFELPLYKGTQADPVEFDSPGIVTLACNIHDWMLAFVYVTDSPWHAVTGDDGDVSFDLPDGAPFEVTVWHPHLGPDRAGEAFTVDAATAELSVTIEPRETFDPRRTRRGSGRYR